MLAANTHKDAIEVAGDLELVSGKFLMQDSQFTLSHIPYQLKVRLLWVT